MLTVFKMLLCCHVAVQNVDVMLFILLWTYASGVENNGMKGIVGENSRG
jgi:hypothetical protein